MVVVLEEKRKSISQGRPTPLQEVDLGGAWCVGKGVCVCVR